MSVTGRLPVALALGVIPVLLRPERSTLWWWLLLVAALTAADLALAASPSRVRFERERTPRVRQGEQTETVLHLTNDSGRRADGWVRDAWQPSAGATGNRHRVDLRPGESTVLRTRLVPVRRGDRLAVAVTVRLRGPVGLACRQRSFVVPGRVRVIPPFLSRRLLPSRLARLRELDGRAAVRVRGTGTEFDSLREYVRGDDVRSIDWRATARTRTTVVRTWQPERDRRVVLVLDTSRTSAGRVGLREAGDLSAVPRLDAAMDAALLLATLASRAGDRVDFVAGDREPRSVVRSGHRGAVLGALEDAMAELEPRLVEADWHRLLATVDNLGRHRALICLLTPLEPAAVEHGLLPRLPALTARHRVVVASVRDPELTALARMRHDRVQAYAAAAAEHALRRRDDTEALFGALGVDVLDVDASDLPAALVDHYLSLKSRGLL